MEYIELCLSPSIKTIEYTQMLAAIGKHSADKSRIDKPVLISLSHETNY